MTTEQMIKEYVDDHFKHFGFYPYDVEVDGMIFSYGNYWTILNDTATTEIYTLSLHDALPIYW